MPNSALVLPRLYINLSAIDRADLQPSTKYKYKREFENLLKAGINPLDFTSLTHYASGLKSSRKSFLKSALRLMSIDYEQKLKSGATPQNIGMTQAAVYRLEAMRSSVAIPKRKGDKAHIWLSQEQVHKMTSLCKNDLEGQRDWIILGILMGAGLRREELSGLTFEALKQQPMKSGKIRNVLQVEGKGAKTRVIPISLTLANKILAWREVVSFGRIARAIGRKKQITPKMSSVAIFRLVQKYGNLIGVPELAPHDLRRTFAQLGYDAGVPITQISVLLGHSSVATTQRYLNLKINLESTASDFIQLAE